MSERAVLGSGSLPRVRMQALTRAWPFAVGVGPMAVLIFTLVSAGWSWMVCADPTARTQPMKIGPRSPMRIDAGLKLLTKEDKPK